MRRRLRARRQDSALRSAGCAAATTSIVVLMTDAEAGEAQTSGTARVSRDCAV
jgi:hypothetical protein